MHFLLFTETFVTAMRHFGHWLEAGYTPVVSVCKRPRSKQLRAKAAEKYSSCSGCSTLLGDNKTKNLLETLRTTLCCLLANDATKRRQTFLKLCAQLSAACWPMTKMPRHFGHWLEAGYTPVVSVCKRPRNKQVCAKAAEKYSSCSGCSTLLGDNKTKNLLETLRTTLCCLLANDATKRRQTFLKLRAQLCAACWPMTNMPHGRYESFCKNEKVHLCHPLTPLES